MYYALLHIAEIFMSFCGKLRCNYFFGSIDKLARSTDARKAACFCYFPQPAIQEFNRESNPVIQIILRLLRTDRIFFEMH
jgi:hypothetical protein